MEKFIINLNAVSEITPNSGFKSIKCFQIAKLIIILLICLNITTAKAGTYSIFEGVADNTTDNTAALNSILTKCDTLFIPSGSDYYKIEGTVIIPSGKTFIFDASAKFNVTGTLKGTATNIVAGEYEIFKSTSIISGTWITDIVYSKWTGAVGDGTTDDFNSLNLFFKLIGITENNKSVLGIEKQYYIKNQIFHTVLREVNLDGRGSKIIRKYPDMTTGESILRFTGSIVATKTVTADLQEGQLNLVLNNTTGLTEQMGIELLSNELFGKEYMGGSSWHYHYKGLLSKIQSIDGNTITMTDSIPHDFIASNISAVRFYHVYPVAIKNLNFGSENISGTNKMNQLVVSQLFDVELNNITCNPLGYAGVSTKSIYNGFFNKITCIKPGAGEDNYTFGVYGIIPDLNVNCVYDSIYGRATTHGIAFTNEPSYNTVVRNSDFKASWEGSNGVDSHASKWIKFENCIIYGAQGNWGTFIFENCEMHEIANGQAHIWNEREGAGRGNLEVYFSNCNFYTIVNGTKATNMFWRTPVLENSTNKYTIVNSNFYLENTISYLFNTCNFGSATDIQPITVEGNQFYGSGTLYLPKNYNTVPSTQNGVFTFKSNVYSLVYWSSPPFDQFQTIDILNNTPANENTSDFYVSWDNRGGNINFKDNVFVGSCFWIKDCSGNIVFDNNEIYNYKIKSSSGYKDRNYLTGNSNLTFTNNNLYNNYWTLTGNQLVSGNNYNGQEQPAAPTGNWENIYTPGNSIETGVTMAGISNFTIISRAKMDDITTNAVQNLVGSSITKLYMGFNPSGTTPVTRPSIRNEDGTIARPVLSKYYLDKEWHNYVFTMENGVLKAYLDGIAMLSYDASAVYNKIYATGTIQIGGVNSTETWSGPIQTFAIYNRVLSLEEANNFSENPSLVLEGELYRLVNPGNSASPIGHWAFDETTGSVAIDSSDNNIQGTLVNGVTWVDGVKNNAIHLDGVNDRVECGINPTLDMGKDDFTVATWLKMDVSQVSYPTIVAKGGSSQKNAGYWFFLSNSKLYFLMGDGGSRISASSNIVNIRDNAWHHVAVTVKRDGNAVFYVDGSSVGSYDVSSFSGKNISNTTRIFTIGSLENSSTTFLKGSLDDFRVYNRVLDANE
ncbi:MAG TPA: LamG-like jellyroll fold domain-containing protein, partial [Bacteroidales bacterium]